MAERDRFYAKVVEGGPNDCWAFKSYHHKGYPQFRRDGGKLAPKHHAIRVAYELEHGPIPADMEVDHTCSNRWCCNPAHGELVTHAENMRRAWARGGRMRQHFAATSTFKAFMADPRPWQEKIVTYGVHKSTAYRWAKTGVQKRHRPKALAS